MTYYTKKNIKRYKKLREEHKTRYVCFVCGKVFDGNYVQYSELPEYPGLKFYCCSIECLHEEKRVVGK